MYWIFLIKILPFFRRVQQERFIEHLNVIRVTVVKHRIATFQDYRIRVLIDLINGHLERLQEISLLKELVRTE